MSHQPYAVHSLFTEVNAVHCCNESNQLAKLASLSDFRPADRFWDSLMSASAVHHGFRATLGGSGSSVFLQTFSFLCDRWVRPLCPLPRSLARLSSFFTIYSHLSFLLISRSIRFLLPVTPRRPSPSPRWSPLATVCSHNVGLPAALLLFLAHHVRL